VCRAVVFEVYVCMHEKTGWLYHYVQLKASEFAAPGTSPTISVTLVYKVVTEG
jgi:hypothetical protein